MSYILIVEDEQDIARLVARTLEKEGFKTRIASSLAEGQELIDKEIPELVILDLMLPDGNGLELCKYLRFQEKTEIPVMILTAKGEEIDRILGFEMGADDYIVKPFSPKELSLRVKAILKRVKQTEAPSAAITIGPLYIDPNSMKVKIDKEEIKLTRTEFNLLLALAKAKGKVLTREILLEKVWGYTFEGYARTVDTHVRRLRKKLGPCAEMIETVWGIGYRFKD
ncbi:two component transcriptional regulator, winged helix family [Thermodesulfatator indicus DSM 15286]|uniref:Phosphate regulon transcriptional regulatory protein PhoB n=1 Tax=Thermodesulfatator indicus (strain DSM 15286 / JCM 11887 / CIR29812) TaxID=667014 RepID=F8AAK6_THEID|nr:response regulator transcription factor [Thermodesulfatator indicus]AEH44278.1 two component transcriptional regulator, winged helix family [Thermodesulfatator indicus DSM 15286]